MKLEKWVQALIIVVLMVLILALVIWGPIPIEPIGDWGGTNTFH